MNVNIFSYTTHPELSLDDLVKVINGISYDTISSDETLKAIICEGHLKVFEAIQITFKCKVPYIIFHYLNTYRISRLHGGWDDMTTQVKSNRYTKVDNLYVSNPINCPEVHEHFDAAIALYYKLIDDGKDLGDARNVLPYMCVETDFYWSVNVTSLMNFLEQRMWIGENTSSHREIAMFAEHIFGLWETLMPKTSELWMNNQL